MANKIDQLIIEIKADTKQLQKDLKQIQGKIKVTGAAGGAAFGAMGASLSKIKVPALAAAASIAAIVLPMKAIASVGAGFEDLKDSLDQVFGSMEAGDAAMDKVFKFAQTTPFQIEDATKAFIQLKSAGIEPSMKMLQTFADTASTSIDQLGAFEALIRIVQRSAAGGMGLEEINQLDDRGIPATKILTEELGKSRDELSIYGKTAEGAAEMVQILIKGLESRFGGAMANKMDNLSTKTSNMVISFKQLADEVFKSGLGDLLKTLTDRLTAFADQAARVVRIKNDRASLGDMVGDKTGKTDALSLPVKLDFAQDLEKESFKRLNAAKQALIDGEGLTGFAFDSLMGAVLTAQKEYDNFKRIVDDFIAERKRLSAPTEETPKVFDVGNIEGLVEFQSVFKKLVQDTVPETKKLQDQMDYIKDLMQTGDEKELKGIMAFLGVKDVSEMQDVVDHLGKLKDGLEEVTTFSSEMQQTIISASNAFTTDFVNSLLAGENALDSFKDFAKNIVSQIIATFLQMAVVNQILNSVFGLTGTNALPTISLGKKAGGGTVQGGSPYMVGERGPEIFVPNTGGTIMNNMNSKNAMGGGTPINIYQNVNFATGVVSTVRAEVTKMMPQIADVTKAAVQESAMRGGNFRRSLVGG
jgi:tape measure domain-containing protein